MTKILHQTLDPTRTTWHITWGTYGARLHGGFGPTVDRQHNQYGEPFIGRDPEREQAEAEAMRHPIRLLTGEQREFIDARVPTVCERGRWTSRVASAGTDHVHVLCDIVREVHGEKVRRLLKRWLGQDLSERWPLEEGARWWPAGGRSRVPTKR